MKREVGRYQATSVLSKGSYVLVTIVDTRTGKVREVTKIDTGDYIGYAEPYWK